MRPNFGLLSLVGISVLCTSVLWNTPTDAKLGSKELKSGRDTTQLITKGRRNRPSQSSSSVSSTTANLQNDMLAVHNKYRSALGIPSLTWSTTLATDAQGWADYLASSGKFEHSSGTNQGENLWKGTAGAFSYTTMAEAWASERQYFKYGVFPDVSTTGNWAAVGHYTQMIWKNTTQIGCAVGRGGGYDVLVCRYSPPGNYTGQYPY